VFLVFIAATMPALAQWADLNQRWEELNEQVEQAYQAGNHDDGSRLAEQAYALARKAFGNRDPRTLTSLNNLAGLYERQGRDGEAEPLYQEALQLRREVLGPRHPDTLGSLHNLAVLYERQGRDGEAEPLYQEVLQLSREVLGPRHPDTLLVQHNSVFNLVAFGRGGEAVQRLREMEPALLGWIGSELFSTEAERVCRHLVASQAVFQDVTLSLALQKQTPAARQLAGTVMLRWKQLQGEEETYLARLVRRSEDPRVRALAQAIAGLRGQLSALTREDNAEEAMKVLAELEAQELKLGRVSRDYQDHLRVRTANLEEVRAALPPGTGLIEFRQYRPVDFRTWKGAEPHWAALLLVGFEEPVLVDLGPVAETLAQMPALLRDVAKEDADRGAQPSAVQPAQAA
jgi:hypothetical protein